MAYTNATERGAVSVLPPTLRSDKAAGTEAVMAEIRLDPGSDIVLRFVSGNYTGPFLPGFHAPDAALGEPTVPSLAFGVRRVDHIGLSTQDEQRVIQHMQHTTGMLSPSSALWGIVGRAGINASTQVECLIAFISDAGRHKHRYMPQMRIYSPAVLLSVNLFWKIRLTKLCAQTN